MTAGSSKRDQFQMQQLAVIDTLYAAAADPGRWGQVVEEFCRLLGEGSAALMHRSRDGSVQIIASNLDPSFGSLYEQHYAALNPWANRTRVAPSLLIQVNDDVVAPTELLKSEFYADWLRPQGVRHPIATIIPLGPGEFLDFALVRKERLGAFSEFECEAFVAVRQHMRRATELARRLERVEIGRGAALRGARALGTGVLLVDVRRRVCAMDEGAEAVIRDGDALSVRAGVVRAPPSHEQRLEEAVYRATGGGCRVAGRSGALLMLPRSGGRLPLSLAIGPLDERDRPLGMTGPLAMILVTDPDRGPKPAEEGLRSLFDLTAAEAKLVVALCSGETLATYAAATGTSLNTVKTHLKRVFDKTGETRQADLIRRVSSDVALRVGSSAD